MTERVTTSLSDVVPEEALSLPSTDWGRFGPGANVVVCPSNVDEVAATIRWAGATGTRVVPIGTGRHTEGNEPSGDFLLLSTSRMASVQIYEPGDLTLTAEAGLGISALSKVTAENRQWLPFDPVDFPRRSLGGLGAAGQTGPLWTGYGELKNHILGMTVVCGDGRFLKLGGRVVKNVAGFDILRPVVGSRGALAVITSLTVRLFPRPVVDRLLVLEAKSLVDLVGPARAVAMASVLPASIVLVRERNVCQLLVRLHGAAETADADQRTVEAAAGVPFVAVDGGSARVLADSVRDIGGESDLALHAFVLPSRLRELLAIVNNMVDLNVCADVYRGSLRVSCASEADADEIVTRVRHGMERVAEDVVVERLPRGSTHSLGTSRVRSDAVLELERGVKRVFDAGNVLWDGRP